MDDNLPPAQPPGEGSIPPQPEPPRLRPPPITFSDTPAATPPPPINRPPPLASSVPAPAPRRSSVLWKIIALLLFIALGISLLLNVKHYGRRLASGSGKSVHHKRQVLEEVVVEDNHSRNKIAVIEIEGVISSADRDRRGHNLVEEVREQLEAATDDRNVQAVILKVNSPGGEVLASDEIHNAIRDFQDDTGKPVIASMQTLAASGGYYVSAPCRWIVANELTLTGSIGVIMHGWNVSGLMDKIGVRAETYKSGAHKDMLSPFRHPDEIDSEERKMVQSLILETYGKFTNIVATGRTGAWKDNKQQGRSLSDSWTDYADGRVLSGTQAYELGLVDELGDFQAAISRAEKIARISDANLIQYQQPFDIGDIFGLLGQSEQKSIKVDIGVDVPKLQAGCLYYVYPLAVP